MQSNDIYWAYTIYDALRGRFADYLGLNSPMAVRPGKFLIYRHVDARDDTCFGLKALVTKLHRTIALAWPNKALVPYARLHSLNHSSAVHEPRSDFDLKGKRKAKDKDSDIEYLGSYSTQKKRQKLEVDENGVIDLCSD